MPDPTVDPTLLTVAFVAGAALLAGWVDAVVGGGGLVQLPALLLGFPTASPAQVLATNKFSSIFGTTTSAVTYYRRVHPDLRTALPMAAVAFVGAIGGALIGLHIPKAAFNPIVLVCLVLVGAYTLLRPELGRETALRWSGASTASRRCSSASSSGSTTVRSDREPGSFLVFALVGLMGYAFLEASAKAKIANVATNLGALVVFAPGGFVMVKVGLVMAAGNLLGGYVGARTAVRLGSGFVRVVFIVVVSAFIVRISLQLLGVWP